MMLQVQTTASKKDDSGDEGKTAMAEQQKELQETLRAVNEQTGEVHRTFSSIAERMGNSAKQLSDHFAKGRAQMSQLMKERKELEETLAADKQKLRHELGDFQNRTQFKMEDLHSADLRLKAENEKLTNDIAQLERDIRAERNMKDLLLGKLEKMAHLFKQQSGEMEDAARITSDSSAKDGKAAVKDVLQAAQ